MLKEENILCLLVKKDAEEVPFSICHFLWESYQYVWSNLCQVNPCEAWKWEFMNMRQRHKRRLEIIKLMLWRKAFYLGIESLELHIYWMNIGSCHLHRFCLFFLGAIPKETLNIAILYNYLFDQTECIAYAPPSPL